MSAATSTILTVSALAAKTGASIYAAHKQAAGNKDAAQIQADADAKALAQAKEIYEQQRQDQGPYRESGYGAMDALNFGLGLPAVSRLNATAVAPAAATPAANPLSPGSVHALTTPNTQANIPGDPNSGVHLQGTKGVFGASNATVNSSGLVKMKAPNGMVYLVSADQVDAATQHGGVRV